MWVTPVYQNESVTWRYELRLYADLGGHLDTCKIQGGSGGYLDVWNILNAKMIWEVFKMSLLSILYLSLVPFSEKSYNSSPFNIFSVCLLENQRRYSVVDTLFVFYTAFNAQEELFLLLVSAIHTVYFSDVEMIRLANIKAFDKVDYPRSFPKYRQLQWSLHTVVSYEFRELASRCQ